MQFLDDSYHCRTEELVNMRKIEDVIVDED